MDYMIVYNSSYLFTLYNNNITIIVVARLCKICEINNDKASWFYKCYNDP